MPILTEFNSLAEAEALALVEYWCAAKSWAADVVGQRPYPDMDTLCAYAEEKWLETDEPSKLEAFAAHPLIGDVELLRKKYAETARAEQGQVMQADETVLQKLADLNVEYRDKFGFIFIVCASGKSAAEMLALLEARLPNTRDQELHNAAVEQAQIMLLRLRQSIDLSE